MPISRGQMPRQMYGLGSLVKSITKGAKSAVKGITSTFKENPLLGLAALNFAPMLAGAKPFIGMGSLAGSKYTIPGISSIMGSLGLDVAKGAKPTLGQFGKVFAIGSLGGAALQALTASGADEEELGNIRDVDTLRSYLRRGYEQLNPGAPPEQINQFVETNTREYAANGGRMEYDKGGPTLSYEEAKAMNPGMFSAEVETDVVRPNTELLNYIKRIKDAAEKGTIPMDFAMDLIKQKTMEQGVDLKDLRDDIMETQRIEQAYGGRMGYAFGNPEQNAINAAGIMNLPLNQNPAGVTELDLRETGGFIPPVGVKEKADDIPAMLSNNEFVMTADAVKQFGDGDVNKGAQRMYDMMKKLENGGRV
jgi:hypothetical protein